MSLIKNTENLTTEQINEELKRGAKFVVFSYTISIIILTFRRGSDIYFIKSNESALNYSWKYSLISLFLGWWGFPFGPIFTITSFFRNFSGGKNVTAEVLNHVNSQQIIEEASKS